ncbi:hypothetical protein V5094_09995 [Moellerella wisconsensis]|uniref:hypothetical protein n=1 Tax=Moellerella wisconsensis TaxID=158849 RepID=UPI0030765F1B
MSGFFNTLKSMAKSVVQSKIFKEFTKKAINLLEEVGLNLLKQAKNKLIAAFTAEEPKKEAIVTPMKTATGDADSLISQISAMKSNNDSVSASGLIPFIGDLAPSMPLLAAK